MARNNNYGIAVPSTTQYAGSLAQKEVARNWEDLLEDEKIERLMQVTTQLWNRVQHLERENQDLRRHQHDQNGNIFVARGIGDHEYDRYPHYDINPFNSKEIEESDEIKNF